MVHTSNVDLKGASPEGTPAPRCSEFYQRLVAPVGAITHEGMDAGICQHTIPALRIQAGVIGSVDGFRATARTFGATFFDGGQFE
jgi:hypothetical protein